ncbi:helix-turn-helix transcriptional regulator [Anaerocolumna sp. MB42-C2]|uniref:helix-turn-helix transcriptional regulator n=1 Tax=Anaerocolumna sp. MB42-C2 TaxID=3070997 RepID=UPI0027E16A9E|nr:helix-turn-helix transcriptional regulator [Anaerocolumna sp. MB42-C2]WMJ85693.1 helix-turn-helix transcriptional regulator [Anaerocolumna sp. MB42-C2]
MKKEIPVLLSNKIREYRIEKKLTQQQLADLVEVSSRTIISLEKGQYNPSVLLAYNLAQIFDLTIENLFNFEEVDHEKE